MRIFTCTGHCSVRVLLLLLLFSFVGGGASKFLHLRSSYSRLSVRLFFERVAKGAR